MITQAILRWTFNLQTALTLLGLAAGVLNAADPAPLAVKISGRETKSEPFMLEIPGVAETSYLKFGKPQNGDTFRAGDTIGIVLESLGPEDYLTGAEILLNGKTIGYASYCCPACKCQQPTPGAPLTLTLWTGYGGLPEQGWNNPQPGRYKLSARGTTRAGNVVDADSIEVVVRDDSVIVLPKEPVVVMDRPVNGDSIPQGDLVVLEATAFAPGDIIGFLEFLEGPNVIAQAWDAGCPPCLTEPCPARPCLLPIPNAPAHFFYYWSNAPAGIHEIHARAVSGMGIEFKSSPTVFKISPVSPFPTVTVKAIDNEASEGPEYDVAVFEVSRTGVSQKPLTVWFNTDGSATRDVDYLLLTQFCTTPCRRLEMELTGNTFVIPEGANSIQIGVKSIHDDLIEGDESVVLRLVDSPVAGPIPPYVLGTYSEDKVVIHDFNASPGATLVITAPKDGEIFKEPAALSIDCTATDPNGSIRHVEFFANDEKIGQSDILTKDADIPGKPRFHHFDWEKVPAGKYILTARAVTAAGGKLVSDPVLIAVHDAQSTTPVVTIEASDRLASENDPADIAVYEIRRSGDKSQPLEVVFDTDGGAKRGVDYVLIPEIMFTPCLACDRLEIIITDNTITFPANQSSVRLGVRALPDDVNEGEETVAIRLLQPPTANVDGAARPSYVVGQPGEDKISITESGSNALIVITKPLDGSSFRIGDDVVIEAVASDPGGYIPQVDFFADGQKIGESGIFFIRAPDPGTKLTHEFLWKSPPSGKHELRVAARDDSRKVVSDPVWIVIEPLTQRIPVVTVYAKKDRVKEWDPADELIFKFFRSGDNTAPLSVNLGLGGTATFRSDYVCSGWFPLGFPLVEPVVPFGGFITFLAGSSESELIIHPVPDKVLEGDESIVVQIRQPIRSAYSVLAFVQPPYGIGEPGLAKGVIVEKVSGPSIVIQMPGNGDVFDAGADVLIRANAVDPEGAITHVVFYANGRKIGESTITFIREPDPGMPIQHEFLWKNPPVGKYELTVKSEGGDLPLVSNPVIIAIEDAPSLPVITVSTPDGEASEPSPGRPDTATFVLTRTGTLDGPITVFYGVDGTARNGRDYTFLDGDATIPAGVAERRIQVHALPDRLIEGTESVVLTLRPSRSYKIGSDSTAQISILDADRPPDATATIVMTDPDDNAEFKRPGVIPIRISTYDPNGVISFAEFFANDEKIGEEGLGFAACVGCGPKPGSVLTIPFNWKKAPAGQYKLTAGGKSSSGEMILSEPVRIVVHDTDPIDPARVLHPADLAPADSTLTLEEIKPYAIAWKSGAKWTVEPNPIPVGYVTRAGALWKGGEKYFYDPNAGSAPLWWVNSSPAVAVPLGADMNVLNPVDAVVEIPRAESGALAQWILPIADDSSVQLVIRVLPAGDVRNYAVEEYLPAGVKIVDISDDGTYDEAGGVIRWGPFFDATPRKISFAIVGARPETLKGIASFDGSDVGIVHVPLPPTPVRDAAASGGKELSNGLRIAHVVRLGTGAMQLTVVDDTPGTGAGCDVEMSDDLVHWQKIGHLNAGGGSGTHLDNDANESEKRYYRVIRRP